MASLITALGFTFGTPALAALFTEAQWGDLQSIANFLVLVYIAYRNERRLPQATADRSAEAIRDEIASDGGLRDDLAELVVEAMARRADRYPHDRNR